MYNYSIQLKIKIKPPLIKFLELAIYRQFVFSTFIVLLTLDIETMFAEVGENLEKEDAVLLLYGDVIFRIEKLSKYFQGQDYGYVSLAFETPYVEAGQNKRIIVARITPKPIEEYNCHACNPVIGGGVLKWSGNDWIVESRNELIGWGNSFGETFSLVEAGPDRHGIMDVINDAHQGYEEKNIRLIVPQDSTLLTVLEVGFAEKPGLAACEDSRLQEQYASIQFVRTKTEFFDITSKLRNNEGSCKKFKVHNQTARYRFVGGTYKKLGH